MPKNRFLAVGMSCLLGLVFPMCECGIVPVMRRLLRKGLPLSSCVSYMLAGPIINVVVIASTYAAFSKHQYGYWIIGLRVGLAFVVAFVAGLVVAMVHRKYGKSLLSPQALPNDHEAEEDAVERQKNPRTLWQRAGNITETALHDFVDITIFLILGACLAAGVGLLVHKNDVADLSVTFPVLSILIMMGLAILLCLCSEADAFVAASFITLQPAAKLAFLVLGPMLDIKLFLLYTRVFRFRLIWTIIFCVVSQVLVYSTVTYYLWHLGVLDWLSGGSPAVAAAASLP
jgi:uncharacterized membrane protein YraQ (UPF0718 family)